jgi:hypothetical protein
MPCPNCGAPLRMVEPTMSVKKGVDYEYTSAKCLGVVERQGMAKKKDGMAHQVQIEALWVVLRASGSKQASVGSQGARSG